MQSNGLLAGRFLYKQIVPALGPILTFNEWLQSSCVNRVPKLSTIIRALMVSQMILLFDSESTEPVRGFDFRIPLFPVSPYNYLLSDFEFVCPLLCCTGEDS